MDEFQVEALSRLSGIGEKISALGERVAVIETQLRDLVPIQARLVSLEKSRDRQYGIVAAVSAAIAFVMPFLKMPLGISTAP